MRNWLKLSIIIITFALISLVCFFIFKLLGITDFNTLKEIINNTNNFSMLIYLLLLVTMLVTLCFVPLLNTSLVVLGIIIFGPLKAYIINIIAIFFSTSILFFIGDKFGESFAVKLIGKKDLEKTQDRFDTKSKIWLPVFFIIPGLPDEALCLVAGMTKMKYWYLILTSLIYHCIEIGIICFLGSGIIDWKSLSIIDWALIINVAIIDFYLITKLEKYVDNKTKPNNNK